MTTPRPAREGHPSEVAGAAGRDAAVPEPADVPDRETLTRVLDGLRDLPRQTRVRRSPDPAPEGGPPLPLPRRRRAPSLG